jgi:hypothetical protein
MLISAEVRWFWRDPAPAGLADWFRNAEPHSCPAGGGRSKSDLYLRDPGQVELGIKQRGGKTGIEVKGLVVSAFGSLQASPFTGPIDLWSKWTSESLELRPEATIAIQKLRWLRKFDTDGATPREIPLNNEEMPVNHQPLPARGCNVELTNVHLPTGDRWWTLGFEAFGTILTVESDVLGIAALLATRRPPALTAGLLASYPTWLKQYAT